MRRIDALFTAWPFLGSRRMTVMLPAIVKADPRRDPGARLAAVGVALEVDVLVKCNTFAQTGRGCCDRKTIWAPEP